MKELTRHEKLVDYEYSIKEKAYIFIFEPTIDQDDLEAFKSIARICNFEMKRIRDDREPNLKFEVKNKSLHNLK